MPFYSVSYTRPRSIMIEQGWPVYLFGTRNPNDAQMYINSVSVTGNVATIAVTGWSGPLPVVGAFLSTSGTQTNGGVFNVNNAVITAVAVDQTGTGTISYALTNGNVAVTPDVGIARIRFASVGDPFTAAGGASIPGSVGNVVGRNGNFLSVQVYMPTGAGTVDLQGSNTNNDADFAVIMNIPIANGRGGASVTTSFEFLRFNVSAVTTAGSIVASINA